MKQEPLPALGVSSPQLARGLIHGLAWSSVARWGGQIITWAATIVVARLLSPSDYGILAMAMIMVGFLDLLSDCGLGYAVVQSRDIGQHDVELTMGLSCALGLLAAGLLFVGAPLWARFYGEPRLTPVIALMSLAVVLTGIYSVPYGILQRRLAFDRIAKAQLAQGVTAGLVTVALAYYVRSYWALVIGFMAGRLALAALIVAAAPILPRLERQLSAPVKALLKFGVVLSGDRILWYFRTNFDIALVGARLGEQALGFYSMALTVARLPAEKLAAVMQPVAYPALSHAQGSQTELQRYFLALTVGAATLVVPVAVGLALTAHLAIPIMLGAHWAAAVVPTIVFSLAVPIIVLWNLSHPTLSAIGRVGLNLRFSLLLAIVAPPAIWVGSYWGVAHVAAASSLALVAVAIYGFAVTWSEIGLPAGTYIAALWPVVSSAAGMAVAVLLAGRYTPAAWPASARLALLVLVGGVVYPALLLTWHGRTIRAQMNALRVAWSASR